MYGWWPPRTRSWRGGNPGGALPEPLLHRLAGYDIRVPPLRERRREDIGLLFHHFAREELAALGEEHPRPEAEAVASPGSLSPWPRGWCSTGGRATSGSCAT